MALPKQPKPALNERQLRAIPLLVAGMSQRDVAKRLHTHAMQITKWRREPEFRAALEQARKDCFDEGIGQLKAAVTEAVRVLREALDSDDESIRLAAASKILGPAIDISGLKKAALDVDIHRPRIEDEPETEEDRELVRGYLEERNAAPATIGVEVVAASSSRVAS